MSTDNLATEKVRVVFKKSKLSTVGELTSLKERFLEPKNQKSPGDLSEGVNSDVTFVLNEEEFPNQYGRLTISRDFDLKTTNENKIPETRPSKRTSEDCFKEEIAAFIIDEIISKIGTPRTISKESYLYSLRHSSSNIVKHMPGLPFEPLMRSSLHVSQKPKENCTGGKSRRELTTVVRELDLPIRPLKGNPYAENRPRFERLKLDTYVTSSSSILPEREGHSRDSLLESSRTSKSQRDGKNTSTSEDRPVTSSPFELCWCFGFNADVPVVNLSDDECSQIVFANSQYAVIYDFNHDNMSFMQGHLNTVSYISANLEGNILVTADSGCETSRIIVWDRRPCVLQVIENAHAHGCQFVGLSPKGDYVITISANEAPTCVKMWEWEKDNRIPATSLVVKDHLGSVKKLTTNVNSNGEFAVTFERTVMFVNVIWQTVLQECSADGRIVKQIKDSEFDISIPTPTKIGSLTDTTFLECSGAIALSSTCKGYVVVWEDTFNSKHKRAYIKYVRLQLKCITTIQTVDKKIAVATISGDVSFYDFNLKFLLIHKLLREPLVSLSFNLNTQRHTVKTGNDSPSCANTWKESKKLFDASLKSNPFSVRNFTVSTESGRIAYVNASCGTPKYLPLPGKEVFTALDMMPNGKFLCAGTASGKCILFDTDQRKVKIAQKMKVQPNLCHGISFLKYSPSGYVLVCGMFTGTIWLLNPLLLTPSLESPLTDCNCCITQMIFTPDSEYLIVIDVSFCITVYFMGETPTMIGQYIAHYGPIITALVDPIEEGTRKIKVFTLSADRSVCKFVIDKERNSFEFIANQRVEQSAVPTYSIYYHYPYSAAGAFLGVNSEYKFRLHDQISDRYRSSVTRRCRGTILAPDFGYPINYMEMFQADNKWYLFFTTKRHLGIHRLPLDGNPFRALGFRASPTDIVHCTIHPNGKHVFSISELCTGMWEINPRAVEEFYRSGGEGLDPFLRMLEDQKQQEIREFFYIGQFLHQGESPNLVRTLKNSLPICEVPNVLQALGCLMTKQEIDELAYEIIHMNQDNPTYSVDYDEFVRLYLNLRKARGLKLEDLHQAFRDFYAGVNCDPNSPETLLKADSDPIFDSMSFIRNLSIVGEDMSEEELHLYFHILTGGDPDSLKDENYMFKIPPGMPKEISFDTFVKDILGFI